VVQAALKIVLELIFEADFHPNSFGFRPKRSAHHALNTITDEAWAGRRVVVERHRQLLRRGRPRHLDGGAR
jgi:RNA-directed DNA polymerase